MSARGLALGCTVAAMAPTLTRLEALPQSRRLRPVRAGGAGRQQDASRPGWREPAPAERPGRLERILTGLRVVVVDDDEDVLEFFVVALTTCGADVSAASNARDGLALARQMRPHVVVSDIAMSGEDGYWLVRELRRAGGDLPSQVPVVATTAFGREHTRARVLAGGFSELLKKPVDPEALCRVVASMAGR
jgi:CheY-like chemotaxis protein